MKDEVTNINYKDIINELLDICFKLTMVINNPLESKSEVIYNAIVLMERIKKEIR